jgi:hypothetical protein
VQRQQQQRALSSRRADKIDSDRVRLPSSMRERWWRLPCLGTGPYNPFLPRFCAGVASRIGAIDAEQHPLFYNARRTPSPVCYTRSPQRRKWRGTFAYSAQQTSLQVRIAH